MDYIEKANKEWGRKRGENIRYKTTDYNLIEEAPQEYYIYIQPSGDIIKDPRDWIRNFTFFPTKTKIGQHTIYVHKGFKESYDELISDLYPRILDAKKIRINGYSLGASTGLLLFAHLKNILDCEIIPPVLYGCPKPFSILNIKGYLYVRNLCKEVLTVRAGKDIVAIVPFNFLSFLKVGKELRINIDHGKQSFKEKLLNIFLDHAKYEGIFNNKSVKIPSKTKSTI